MNSINLNLLRRHIEDADRRASKTGDTKDDRILKQNWSEEALEKTERFKDRIIEVLMRRAKDFYIDTNQEMREPKMRFAKATVTVVMWEELVHSGMEAFPEFLFVDGDGSFIIPNDVARQRGSRPLICIEPFDSPETANRIESINAALAIGCGPPSS